MEQIKLALLCGHRQTTVNGITIDLKPLPRDTQKQRERLAEIEAQKIIKLLN
jgi:hypothetical protein